MVYPKRLSFNTLSRIGIEDSMIHPNGLMVRTIDVNKTSACGEIDINILVDPREFEVSFVVLDIPTVLNLFLGRPWIHSTGAIPSSLHLKVKIYIENKLATVMAELVIPVLASTMVPSIDW